MSAEGQQVPVADILRWFEGESPSDGPEFQWALTARSYGVSVTAAEAAQVCGALGCRSGEQLLLVELEREHDRVLCPDCAVDYIHTRVVGE